MKHLTTSEVERVISTITEESYAKQVHERHFKKFVKIMMYMLQDSTEASIGSVAWINYYLNSRKENGAPVEVDMEIIFKTKERKGDTQ